MSAEASIADLLRGVGAGDRAALRALYARESVRLFGIAHAILLDRDAAAEALQDTFLRISLRAAPFDPAHGAAEAWLAGIVRHAALDHPCRRGAEMPGDQPVPPEAPPPGLWERIEAALPGATPSFVAPVPGVPRWWRFLAVSATAAAFGLLALVLLPPPERMEGPWLTGVLLSSRDQPAWVVEVADGIIRLAAVNPQPAAADRVLQLWALPPGATAPTALGLIPPEGRMRVTPAAISPAPGMLIQISQEPPGGSPTGRPTGPILFIGRLTVAGGA